MPAELAGDTAEICVLLSIVYEATVEPNFTAPVDAAAENPVPVMVTVVAPPTGPDCGLMAVTVGATT